MFNDIKNIFKKSFFIIFFIPDLYSDNFEYNTYNNYGMVGLINTPTARFHEAGSYGFSFYNGTPDQKIIASSSPYDWLEASVFYTNIEENPAGCNFETCRKDKGFNFKIRLKEEGALPALAIGINDIGGTGLYGSEYLVASYGINNLDMHFGLGWGSMNGIESSSIKNPLGYISDKFYDRPDEVTFQGGTFSPSTYFSGETVTPFYGVAYLVHPKILLKIEHDPTYTENVEIKYENPKSRTTFGFDYLINKNFNLGFAIERDNYFSLRFSFKQDLSTSKSYEYKRPEKKENETTYNNFIRNLEANGVGVNKIVENSENIGVEITQFTHPSLDVVEQIIKTAKGESGLQKNIKVDYKIAELKAYSEYDDEFLANASLIYERNDLRKFNTDTRFTIRPFLAAREDFLKLAVLVQNDSEYIIKENFFFSSNLKYSIWDNFDDLSVPPLDTYPAQVRSDVKDYLNNFDSGVIIGRAQFDYHITPKKNHHLMFTAGILEEMFSGAGFEYLYFQSKKNYAMGFELFHVVKRDYEMRFGTLDYKNTVGSLNFYYRNYDLIPFDAKISVGEYLAGDFGTTFELSRTYYNGTKFGVFATFTDVPEEKFGEGSFDKGIFFNIPIAGGIGSYTWRPLTKDPGARLTRKYTLHDLLVKFKPFNE